MKGKICSLISVLFLTGCSDFLEERSQDEVRPSMVNDLEQILLSFLASRNTSAEI